MIRNQDSARAGDETDSPASIRFSLQSLLMLVAVAGLLMTVPWIGVPNVGTGLLLTAAMLLAMMGLQWPVFLILRRAIGGDAE